MRASRTAAFLLSSVCAALPAATAVPITESSTSLTAREQPPLPAGRLAAHLASFDEVWTTVRDRHWDPQLGGVDWSGARERLRPRMEAVRSDEEATHILTELLAVLGLSHFSIIPQGAYAGAIEGPRGQAVAGITIRLIDGKPVVVQIESESAADRADVRTGWILHSINDRPVAQAIEQLEQQAEATGERSGTMSSLAAEMMMTGDVGEAIRIAFTNGEGELIERVLTLQASPDPAFGFGNLPEMPVRIRFSTFEDRVGHFSFSTFLDPPRLMSAFEDAIAASRDLDGLIIDLRGNLGGIMLLCNGMAGWLIETPTAELGTLEMRTTQLNLVANQRPDPFPGPVAVLIDERSISAAEILAGGLRDIGRARLFGSVTAGMSLPANIVRLPNGDGFMYAMANYRSASGRILEHNGVEPHEHIPLDRAALLGGRDPALERAAAWIAEQRRLRPAKDDSNQSE